MNESDRQVKQDQSRTHVVELVDVKVRAGGEGIADMLTRIGARAIAAGMVILSTTISTNTYILVEPRLVVTIICHWQNRESLESLQRQNALMGQPGPRRMS